MIEAYAPARWVLGELLEGSGFRVLSACDVDEGLRICEREHHVDVLLADLHSGECSRAAAIARIRACEPLRAVMLTADLCPGEDDAVADVVRGRDTTFFAKPLDYNALERALHRLFGAEPVTPKRAG